VKKISSYLVGLLSGCFVLISTVSLFASHFLSPPVLAQESFPQPWGDISKNCLGQIPGTEDVATIQGFECLFINIVRILTPIAGLAMFVMLIVGSFQLLTAGGDAKAMQKARSTLTYAIGGLVVFLGIWFILKLIQTITGVDVTKFEIPGPL